MRRLFGISLVSLVLVSVIVISLANTPQVSADMMIISTLNEGAAIHNGTHVYMPEACVRINITAESSIYLNLRAEFQLLTNITQNVTLGFVLPQFWETSVSGSSSLFIYENEAEIEYRHLSWDDLGADQGFSEELIDTFGMWLTQVEYAVFNLEMHADITANLTVTSSIICSPYLAHKFVYSYIVASARTFEGDTHELVHMQLVEEEPFLAVSFGPESYLNLTKDGIQSNAIWDFNISEFTDTAVRMYAKIREYQSGGKPLNYIGFLILASAVAIVAIPVFFKFRSRYKKIL